MVKILYFMLKYKTVIFKMDKSYKYKPVVDCEDWKLLEIVPQVKKFVIRDRRIRVSQTESHATSYLLDLPTGTKTL